MKLTSWGFPRAAAMLLHSFWTNSSEKELAGRLLCRSTKGILNTGQEFTLCSVWRRGPETSGNTATEELLPVDTFKISALERLSQTAAVCMLCCFVVGGDINIFNFGWWIFMLDNFKCACVVYYNQVSFILKAQPDEPSDLTLTQVTRTASSVEPDWPGLRASAGPLHSLQRHDCQINCARKPVYWSYTLIQKILLQVLHWHCYFSKEYNDEKVLVIVLKVLKITLWLLSLDFHYWCISNGVGFLSMPQGGIASLVRWFSVDSSHYWLAGAREGTILLFFTEII